MKVHTFFLLIIFSIPLTAHEWHEAPKFTNNDLLSVSAENDSVAWICGKNGTVFLTLTGGRTWIDRSNNPAYQNLDLVHIFGENANLAFVIANPIDQTGKTEADLFRSGDRGLNWQKVLTISGTQGNSVFMFNTKQGAFLGNPINGKWQIFLTKDGGLTWDSAGIKIPSPTSDEISYTNGMFGDQDTHYLMFGTNKGRYYISKDLGKTWQSNTVPGLSEIHCIAFADTLTGVIAGTGLLKTTDGGKTWKDNSALVPGQGTITAMISHDFWHIFLIRAGDGTTDIGNHVYHTGNLTDSNWDTAYTAWDMQPFLYLGEARNGGYTYGLRKGGGLAIAVHDDPAVTGVDDKKKTPAEFSLAQNYPNPFNPVTNIGYTVPKNSYITLKVYDILGNNIATLVNEEKPAGNYTINFNAADLPSGFYIYELKASNGFSMSRKMVLLK
ncbi:MAG: T9SS type A sorting domain-containing protein [Bacteroidota bacterium]|nr:T9SS type A sorting domain-containing protein [Bacteroidota bacterium]